MIRLFYVSCVYKYRTKAYRLGFKSYEEAVKFVKALAKSNKHLKEERFQNIEIKES